MLNDCPEPRAERLPPAGNGGVNYKRCVKCGARHSALVLCPVLPECPECGGKHERSGARTDCIRHWKYRALEAENTLLVQKVYGV